MENLDGLSGATRALIAFAGDPHSTGPAQWDNADVSGTGLASHVAGAPWWDGIWGGIQLAARDMAHASLRHADLARAGLQGANLSQASCNGINLQGARMEEAVLRGADLIGGKLAGVDAGEADFSDAMLEDADLQGAGLRFAIFTGAVMDGAKLSRADLWGARLSNVTAERAELRDARLDEADAHGADFTAADLTGASLRRTNLAGARLGRACLRNAVLDGADLTGADLTGAILPHVTLTTCGLQNIRWAGAWLERTRMRAHQLGPMIGEELAGDHEAAREGYIVLEQNFRSLGIGEDESWAFRRRRRMGKRMHATHAIVAIRRGRIAAAMGAAARFVSDQVAEWLCDYGQSLTRVLGTLVCVALSFAFTYWATGCLEPRPGVAGGGWMAVNYFLYSLDSMTTVGTGDIGLRPNGQLGALLSSLETVIGIILLGLFGFVLGVRMRN